jgi:hypothetical protein
MVKATRFVFAPTVSVPCQMPTIVWAWRVVTAARRMVAQRMVRFMEPPGSLVLVATK